MYWCSKNPVVFFILFSRIFIDILTFKPSPCVFYRKIVVRSTISWRLVTATIIMKGVINQEYSFKNLSKKRLVVLES